MMANPVVILGMHRSGTSFLARALNLSGLWLGMEDDLQTVEGRAAAGNPKGNYENKRIIAINDALLAHSGGQWDQPPDKIQAPVSVRLSMLTVLYDLEKSMPPGYVTWGWKDPRTVLTFGIWRDLLQRPLTILAAIRHPAMVAESLHRRDQMPKDHAYKLWTGYNMRLLQLMAENPSRVIRFDVPKPELLGQVARVFDELGFRAVPDRIEQWFDARLLRSVPSSDDIDPLQECAETRDVWEALLPLVS